MTSHAQDATAQSVIQFWFDESSPKQWFTKDAAFDAAIQTRFGKLLEQAALGEFWGWRSDALGRLAEIIVLDQFSRNVWRDTPKCSPRDACERPSASLRSRIELFIGVAPWRSR